MEMTRTKEPNRDHHKIRLTRHHEFTIRHFLSAVQVCTVRSQALSSYILSSSTKWMFLCSQEWT